MTAHPNLTRQIEHSVLSAVDFETSPSRSFDEVSNQPLDRIKTKFQRITEHGTHRAYKYPSSSVPADSTTSLKRGGARNSAARQSHALTEKQIANLTQASSFAGKIGLPFTRMITIDWEKAGLELGMMAKATGRFLDLLTKTIRRHGGQTAWLWVHERGVNIGGHAHILVHIPSELMPIVRKRQRGWLKRITGKAYRNGVILGKPIGGRVGLEQNNLSVLIANVETTVLYCVKGADNNAAETYQLVLVKNGGLIVGKRCGVSQNIGPKARKSAAKLD